MPALTVPPAAPAPVGLPLAGLLVTGAALGGYALACWPRRWTPSAAAIRATLVDRREPRLGDYRLIGIRTDSITLPSRGLRRRISSSPPVRGTASITTSKVPQSSLVPSEAVAKSSTRTVPA